MARFRTLVMALFALASFAPAQAAEPSRPQILQTMKRATQFMVDKVSTGGGYVWSYLPDMSRRWGELEAAPTMIWVQPPGTATMGHLFLDAYHATGDDYYYQAAAKAADALAFGQLPTGGWNYFVDFGGEASTKHWYDTVGKNAWRMEEFQHYWGNATFDDDGTSESLQLLLRIYVEKHDPKYLPPLQKGIDFVLASQYPIGGWPQRWPLKHEFVHHGRADYTSYIAFNDDVTAKNVEFLLQCYQVLGDARVLDAIHRGMNVYLVTQQGQPQPGWGLQHDPLDLKPMGARTYEPNAIVTHTTASSIRQLMGFYRLTGDAKFLARIPEALDWLASVAVQRNGKTVYPTFIEIGTGKPLYLHRRGSNVVNGEYYTSGDPENVVGHYGSFRTIDVAGLRKEYAALKAMPVAEVIKGSPLKATGPMPLARYVVTNAIDSSDLNDDKTAKTPAQLVKSLNPQGWWPTQLNATSNPYRGDGPAAVQPGDFRSTRVGDATDTSPYITDKPVIGISTGTYMAHMATLIGALDKGR